MCDYEKSEIKMPKTAKNDLTPENLPSVITTTPSTPSIPNNGYDNDFSFLRRLYSQSSNSKKKGKSYIKITFF